MGRLRRRYKFCNTNKQILAYQLRQLWTGTQWVNKGIYPVYFQPNVLYPYSEYESCEDELHKGPPYKKGGPLDIICQKGPAWVPGPDFQNVISRTLGSTRYILLTGTPAITYNPWLLKPTTLAANDLRLKDAIDAACDTVYSHGEKAYQTFSPIKPHVDIGQTVAEISELPRMLRSSARIFLKEWRSWLSWKRKLKNPRSYADEWLNIQFGWRPFLRTLYDLCITINETQDIITRLRKFNGKWERRGGRVGIVDKSDQIYTGTGYVNFETNTIFVRTHQVVITRQTIQNVWFQADYKYWIPELDSGKIPYSVIAQIYGLRITPQLVWELIPWSWMIDWFTNIKQILTAADERSFGQLVSRNAWLMGKTSIVDKLHLDINVSGVHRQKDVIYDLTRKQRYASTPYGFGVHSTDLSPWKVSILSALGISRYF